MSRIYATAPVTLYVNSSTGNDSNDGLTTSTALHHIQTAFGILMNNYDLAGQTGTVSVAAGLTYNEAVSIGGVPTGNNLLTLDTHGAGSVLWLSQTTCLTFGDGTMIAVNGNFIWGGGQGNTPNSCCIYLHNYAVLDLGGTQLMSGGGSNVSGISLDGPCIVTIANGIEIQGGYNYFYNLTRAGKLTASGAHTLNSCGMTGLFNINSNSDVNLGASFPIVGAPSVGASRVSGNSVFNSNGISVPGGINTDSGGIVCTSYS